MPNPMPLHLNRRHRNRYQIRTWTWHHLINMVMTMMMKTMSTTSMRTSTLAPPATKCTCLLLWVMKKHSRFISRSVGKPRKSLTALHQQLLGIRKVPQRPNAKPNAVAPQPPASQPLPDKDVDMAPLDQHGDDYDDEDHVDDINAYINIGACSNEMYMPPPMGDEEAFRTHVEQPRKPKTVTQRLVFTGISQEDNTPPEAGDLAQQKPSTIFSPNTLNKAVNEIGEHPQ